jgi:hypothetical protein
MGKTVTEEDIAKWQQKRETQLKDRYPEWAKAGELLTNPPSSPPPTDTAEKLYLQIRICAEQYTGSKYVKKEYQIELPANVVGLGGEADLSLETRTRTWVQLAIPVILQAPSSSSPEEVTLTAPSIQPTDQGWVETARWEENGKTFVRKDRFIPG